MGLAGSTIPTSYIFLQSGLLTTHWGIQHYNEILDEDFIKVVMFISGPDFFSAAPDEIEYFFYYRV